MKPTAKKGIIATAGVAAACAACCTVPIVAAVGVGAAAAPVGILAVILATVVGVWGWPRQRDKSQEN
jgi:hypothetical protein